VLHRFPQGFLFLLSFLGITCQASQEFPSDYAGDQIHFGQGGGFTGEATHFVLLEDGRVFQKESRDSTYALNDEWEKAFASQMFENYKLLGLRRIDHYHPGNLYYFIEYHSKGQTHRISWGQSGYTPDPRILAYYNVLYKSTKPSS
jgi:hypothetical protein